MKPVNLNECAEHVVSDLEAIIADTGGIVEWEELPNVIGDYSGLVRVLQNLVGNALKFHGEEKPVVKISSKLVDGLWKVSVADNGIGMEQKYLEHIFLPFKRLHGKDDYEGSGIGLSVCHKIIIRHGGEVTVESEPGAGSKFNFTLQPSNVIKVKEPENAKTV